MKAHHNQPWRTWNPDKHWREHEARAIHGDRFVDLMIEAQMPILKRDLTIMKRRDWV